ncbi:MAG: hypothetical protein U0J50_01865 [Peptacetobacter hiranonis]|nr:hypothetical protein [Peptacetobacter hiranonis]
MANLSFVSQNKEGTIFRKYVIVWWINFILLSIDYYIFNIDDFYYDYDYGYDMTSWDMNYLVNKKTNKIYSYSSDHVLRFVK